MFKNYSDLETTSDSGSVVVTLASELPGAEQIDSPPMFASKPKVKAPLAISYSNLLKAGGVFALGTLGFVGLKWSGALEVLGSWFGGEAKSRSNTDSKAIKPANREDTLTVVRQSLAGTTAKLVGGDSVTRDFDLSALTLSRSTIGQRLTHFQELSLDPQSVLTSVSKEEKKGKQSSETAGTRVDKSIKGKTSVFSTETGKASIIVTADNNAPVLFGDDNALKYRTGSGPRRINPKILVEDVDNTTLCGATIEITSGFTGNQDYLRFADQNGITGTYNGLTGALSLSGLVSVSDYQTALRSVQYENVMLNPSLVLRVITFMVNDGINSGRTTRDIMISNSITFCENPYDMSCWLSISGISVVGVLAGLYILYKKCCGVTDAAEATRRATRRARARRSCCQKVKKAVKIVFCLPFLFCYLGSRYCYEVVTNASTRRNCCKFFTDAITRRKCCKCCKCCERNDAVAAPPGVQ